MSERRDIRAGIIPTEWKNNMIHLQRLRFANESEPQKLGIGLAHLGKISLDVIVSDRALTLTIEKVSETPAEGMSDTSGHWQDHVLLTADSVASIFHNDPEVQRIPTNHTYAFGGVLYRIAIIMEGEAKIEERKAPEEFDPAPAPDVVVAPAKRGRPKKVAGNG